MARTTWRDLGLRKLVLPGLMLAYFSVVSVVASSIAFHLPETQAIPLAWYSLAFAALIILVQIWLSSIPLMVGGAFLAMAPVVLFMFIMARWNLLGTMVAGVFALGIVMATTSSYKQTIMRRQRDGNDPGADQ